MPLFFPFENEKMKMINLLGGREGPVGQIWCEVSANQLSRILLQVTLRGQLLCYYLPGRERVRVQTCFEGEGFGGRQKEGFAGLAEMPHPPSVWLRRATSYPLNWLCPPGGHSGRQVDVDEMPFDSTLLSSFCNEFVNKSMNMLEPSHP